MSVLQYCKAAFKYSLTAKQKSQLWPQQLNFELIRNCCRSTPPKIYSTNYDTMTPYLAELTAAMIDIITMLNFNKADHQIHCI